MVGGNGSRATKSAEYALRQCHRSTAEQHKKHCYRYKKGTSVRTLLFRSYWEREGVGAGNKLKVKVSLQAGGGVRELVARHGTEDGDWRKRKEALDCLVMRSACPVSRGTNTARECIGTAKATCFTCRAWYPRTVSYLH